MLVNVKRRTASAAWFKLFQLYAREQSSRFALLLVLARALEISHHVVIHRQLLFTMVTVQKVT